MSEASVGRKIFVMVILIMMIMMMMLEEIWIKIETTLTL